MEPAAKDPYLQYSELLVKAFEKIQKQLPKKYKELKDLCIEATGKYFDCFNEFNLEKVKQEREGPYNANKYFYILKMALDTKITKIIDPILYIIQKLISYEFLDGNCEDNCIYPDDQKPPTRNGKLPRKLIDAIVESLCNCATDKDSHVQLQLIKTLLCVVLTFNCKVHEKSLFEIFRACYQIHITTTYAINQNTAKASLTQMINSVFERMEACSGNFGIALSKLQQRNSFIHHKTNSSTDDGDISVKHSEKSLKIRKGNNSIEDEKLSQDLSQKTESAQQTQHHNTSGQGANNNNILINFSAYDQYVFQVVQNMVDDVCLFDARQNLIGNKYMSQLNTLGTSADMEEKQALEEMMQNELKSVQLRSVPLKVSKEDGSKTKKQVQVDIKNEHGIPAGKFGWCIVCRNAANLYCKDTRHPVCSFECKQKHVNLIDSMEAPKIEGFPNFHNIEEARIRFTDALTIFKSICKLCIKEIPNQNINTLLMRQKILGLELILAVVQKPGTTFLNRKEFIDIIKDNLFESLLKYSVSNEKTIFSASLSIFYCLFLHFREHLKQEIVVFIDQIFLRILDSGNSNYHHKYLILTVFDKISQNTKHQLEIFINYDCDFKQKNIFERIIDSLSKIAQGKFQKTEHSNIITAQEEYSLRLYALQILVQNLRNINKTIEAEIAESKLAQREVSQSNKRESSVDNHSDDEEQKEDEKKSNTLDNLEKTRQVKNELLRASIKFNFKPKNGINYLISKQLIVKEPMEQQITDIVSFLKTTSTLDKTAVGDYLGEDVELNKKVLYEYINQFNFEDAPFVDAIRKMLSGFRLPGEGQKVDRIMEIFGEKYCKDNHDAFGNAECIYILAYATMMLQTSMHNPQASKEKMTLEDYVKMCKGINAGKDVDRDFLTDIYTKVEAEPFTLAEDEDAKLKILGSQANSYKIKQHLYTQEAQGIIKRSAEIIKQKSTNDQFILVNDTDPIKPMFETTWSANLAVFSVLLEESDDVKITELCIEGFTHAIKISGYYNMNTERDAFVSSLSKFTQVSAIKEIKEKNIECIRALLNLATYEGNYLKNSWFYVLDCISKIDYMHVLGTGARKDSEFFKANVKNAKNVQLQRKLEREQTMILNSELIVQNIDLNKIDLIIQRSVNLDSEAIIDFINNLCAVSKDELNDPENPRKFSLQRLVEVADFNMGRIRFVWSKIWSALSEHFGIVGSHSNLNVALYAIDSLRQLADKFLLKDEFGHYNFQKDFLKPFETIMLHNLHTRLEIKEFIVMAIANMCRAKAGYIKSGWIVIINIFTLAAQDSEEHLVVQSFEALKLAVKTQFGQLEDNFVELVNCLNKYTKNNFHKQSLEALDLLLECARNLSQRKEIIQNFIKLNGINFYQRDRDNMQRYPQHYGIQKQSPSKEDLKSARSNSNNQYIAGDIEQPDESRIRHSVQKGLWFPILTNLTNLIMEKRKDIQDQAFFVLFKILNDYNQDFTLDFWKEILNQIILPLLEDIHLAVEIPNKNTDSEFFKETIKDLLERMNQFMIQHIDSLRQLIPDYIDVLALFISNINEKHIASVVINQFKQFILQVGKSISPNQWNSYVISLQNLFEATIPVSLIEEKERFQESQQHSDGRQQMIAPKGRPSNLSETSSKQGTELPFNQDACFTKCIVQLLLINTVADTVDKFYDQLSLHNLYILLECLDRSYKFAKEFNQELGLRLKLWNEGFMADLKQLPGLTAQERESISTYLSILFKMYFNPKDGQNIESNSKKLFELCSKVLKDYCLQQSELITINNSKQEESNKNIADIDDEQEGEGEEKQLSLSNLHENELERQLQNITPIVSNIILANLLKLSEDDLRKHVKEIGPLLIDLSLCNNYEIRVANKELLSRIFEYLVQKLH